MKKILALLITALAAAAFTAAAFAQELKLSGEAKTGIFWQKVQTEGENELTRKIPQVTLHSQDDAGGEEGRFRLNMDYDNSNNFGFRARIQWETWKNEYPNWQYAFGYGNFFNNQMTVSVGKLGGSPWGTGGPEMWRELEVTRYGGMRIEWKPGFIAEENGKLNVGFVLNYFDADRDQGFADLQVTLTEVLKESIIGVSYTHDRFMARFAYRLDSNLDGIQGNKDTDDRGKGEDELLYRLEEHVLNDMVPGLSVWALGSLRGLVDVHNDSVRYYRNWVFAQYAPEMFTAQMRIGYDYEENKSILHVRPNFYWHFFDRLLSVGAMFQYARDFGDGVWEGSPFYFIEVEPRIQLNFTSSYIAFAYNFQRKYVNWVPAMGAADPIQQTQWINLRFCIYF